MESVFDNWPVAHAALSQQLFQHQDGYTLLPIRAQDRENIRQWRNEQLDILRQREPLTPEAQNRYFGEVVRPLFQQTRPAQLLFSLLHDDQLIGYGGLVHIDWEAGRAEVSFLLETSRNRDIPTFQRDFGAYLRLLQQAAFGASPLRKLNTEAYDVRPYLTPVLEAAGFRLEARLRQHVRVAGQLVDTLIHSCFRPEAPAAARVPVVLVTSIARKVPLLQAVRTAVQAFHHAGRLVGADANPACVGRHFTDDFWLMPAPTNENLPQIMAGCRQRGITHVVPTRDGELLFWSRQRELLAAQGISVLVSGPAGVERCLDKLHFAEFGLQHQLPVIPAALSAAELPGTTAFVVKERRGAGSQQLGLNLPRPAALAHAAHLREPLFQPYLMGREISVDAYVSCRGRVHGLVLRTRDLVVNGESQITTTFDDDALAARLTTSIEQLELYGPVVLQALLDAKNNLHLIECNCRFGGASSLAVAKGLAVFQWFLLEAAGQDLAAVPFVPVAGALRQVRYPTDLVTVVPAC